MVCCAAILASGWIAAAATLVAPGNYPLNLIATRDGTIVSSNSGWGKHFLQAYDEASRRVTSQLELPSLWYGLAYMPEHRLLLASSGAEDVYIVSLERGQLRLKRTITIPGCKVTAGLAAVDSSTAVVACNQSHEVVKFEVPDGSLVARTRTGEYPYAVRNLGQDRVGITMLGASTVMMFDTRTLAPEGSASVGRHPSDLMILPGGSRIAVACSDSDSISIVDLPTLRETRRYDLTIRERKLSGVQPDALAYDPKAGRLWVALAAVNALAVFDGNAGEFRFIGLVPVGPMPAALTLSEATGTLFIASAREARTGPNAAAPAGRFEFVGNWMKGGIEALSSADRDRLAARPLTLSRQLYGRRRQHLSRETQARVRQFTGSATPIRHVFYVIKENRTYDQVLGDIKEGAGDPELTLFGERVTPNHHQLAREFLLFDRFFVNGYVSADGHLWSTAATSTGYVDRLWPLSYSDRAPSALDSAYDGDADHDRPVAAPGSGFLWDRALSAGISFRNYGEWNVENDPKTDRNYLAGLKDHFDPHYLDAIGDVSDQARVDEFEREFREFEQTGTLPRFVLIHLPNDHTLGAKAGYPTPTAMVADNDLALGRLVDTISHSRYWPESAIFVVEDDAQDGPDHIDARRSVLLVISPYTRRNAVVHAEYSTVSVVKTIGQLLGLRSLTYFDDRAPSLLAEFDSGPKPEPYRHREAQVNLHQTTPVGALGSKESASWDFSHPDRVPDDELNRVIWQSVKGMASQPPPVHTQVGLYRSSRR